MKLSHAAAFLIPMKITRGTPRAIELNEDPNGSFTANGQFFHLRLTNFFYFYCLKN